VLILLALLGCDTPTCLDGDTTCRMPTPCPEVSYTCDSGTTEVRVLGPGDPHPGGMAALASAGDIILGNDKVVAVIEALDHPHYIAPAGGALLDLSIRGKDNDSLRHIFTATGLLPEEAAHYTSLELIDNGDIKAVQLIGTLDGYPDVPIATRYEIRPCEPGIRVRTEIANGTPDPMSLYLTDAFYWGDRGSLAFTPAPEGGFTHPSFGLTTIGDAFFDVPYMISGLHSAPATTYGVVSCDEKTVSGFQSVYVSGMGPAPRVFPSRDWQVYERFILAADGPSISGGADIALELRKQLWDEDYVTITGKVEAPGGHVGDTMRATVELNSGLTPWTDILPNPDGTFSARVPAGQVYTANVTAFGHTVLSQPLNDGGTVTADLDIGTLTLPAVGEVTLSATIDGVPDEALIFVVPSDDATELAVGATTFGGVWDTCAPLLGLPHGGSPGCNRVLVNADTTIALPDGTYDFYSAAGPFTTLGAVQGVRVEAGTAASVTVAIRTLDLQPAGTLSADFHVHGGASFDSEIPDTDRVRAFLASRIQIIITTEHDVVNDYAEAMAALGASARLHLITGTESTGHILFKFRDDYDFPQVIGHWIFWPLRYDEDAPYRGAAWDEKAEPGLLMTHQRDAGWDDEAGVSQLNHPFGGSQFGRDYSWASAAGFDLTQPLKTEYDGTGQSLYFHTPDGADYSNADYDVQEVMNGSKNESFMQYRALWFYLLNQGVVRGGTANSDSHSLTENVLGTPRNLVYSSATFDNFDLAVFDADVRAGHILGTSGPVVEVNVGVHVPGVEVFTPTASDVLHVRVRAAPWVPVKEVRIIVNGSVARTVTDLPEPTDPFGVDGMDRLDIDIPLTDILPASGDAWIVVEAGTPLAASEDLDCNGVPDTGDNNEDGVIDWQDVADLTEDPEQDCFTTVGPLAEPPEPDRGTTDWYYRTVTPGGYPLAFTNPLLLDRESGGIFQAGE